MPGVVAALALLLLNFGLMAAIILYSPTPRGGRRPSQSNGHCFVCETSELEETTVSEYPVCASCEEEYFQGIR